MIEVFTDGASQGNPGISGAGIYVKTDNGHYSYAIPLEEMTNHEAEFHAVIHALHICIETFADDIISIQSDSQLVVQAIENDYVRNEKYQPLLKQIREKIPYFSHLFAKWIPSKQNFHADRLAKQAIQEQLST